ncbi:hypothetical protein [Paenibacillus eucommiae]|uniref:Uncharacterized protein n=1 Tax=Paenibacillus eucommiae TaxID=1355755 RepID=A0ABS4IPX9_9BACL|nr:hypothetical protein [Paenibacillus eucommiae]MBP1989629.1 hypothetical protein [Paenibacillus eucommiae]
MKFKFVVFLIFAILTFVLVGCNNKNDSYSANESPPQNVSESFYKKSVEILNFYVKKIETKTLYTNEDNEYLLGYYRSTPTESSEELMIKTSLTYLDLIYKNFEINLKGNKEDEEESKIKEFQKQLNEVLNLLDIDAK